MAAQKCRHLTVTDSPTKRHLILIAELPKPSQETVAPAADGGASSTNHAAPAWPLLPFLGLWVMVCLGLSDHWKMNPQYHYGWFVPALALFAGWERWQSRPAPGSALSGAVWIILGLVAILPAAWLFSQPNPDWPLFNWLFVALIVSVSLAGIGLAGGWAWMRHFSFPAALMFTAVPWPDQLESPVMQGLMRTAAAVGVVALDILGVAALQHGNLIEVSTGVVGVDEACSGIRSLQGSLMAAIFLGELFRFKIGRRLSLVAFSLVFAFVTNVFRVGFLSWSAARDGLGAVDRWHDPAGFTTLAICVGAILVLAFFMDRNSGPLRVLAHVPAATPFPRWLAPTLIVWIAVTLVGTELWYRDAGPTPEGPWTVAVPAESKPIAVAPSARAQLRYDTAQGATWAEPGGARWLIYFFDWSYGPAFSRVAASMHNPGICLPASGRELTEERGKLVFNVDGEPLAFRGYTFNEGGKPLFVYHGVWQFRSERGMSHGPLSESKQAASIQSVLWRERRIGQQAAELAVWGCTTVEEADAAFQKLLPTLIRPRRAALAAAL